MSRLLGGAGAATGTRIPSLFGTKWVSMGRAIETGGMLLNWAAAGGMGWGNPCET